MTDRRNTCDLGQNCICNRDGEPYCAHQYRDPDRFSVKLAVGILIACVAFVLLGCGVVAFRYWTAIWSVQP